VQPDSYGKRGRWLSKIQEFDLEVKKKKLGKVQGLAKLLTESNFIALGINNLQGYEECVDIDEIDDQIAAIRIEEKFTSSSWYKYIVSYLLNLNRPSDLSPYKDKTLKLHAVNYYISESQLYWKDPLGFLLVCLVELETEKFINEFHEC
jgi:hypothetical protein